MHTFETYYCAEAINESNCSSCGDLVCDTPADANTGNSGGYSPDLTNIMSYYSNRDHFTDGQSIRMKSAILNNSLLQQVVGTSCLEPNFNVSRISVQEEFCDTKYHYVKFIIGNRQPNETYNFFVVPIPGMTHGWGNNDRYVFQIPKNYSSYLEFSVKGTNSFGSKTVFTEAEIYPCGSYSKTSNSITIYPNPANDILEIEFKNTTDNEQSIVIYDYFSNIVFENRNNKNKKLSINTGNFKNGLYILQINNETETITKKFIIQH